MQESIFDCIGDFDSHSSRQANRTSRILAVITTIRASDRTGDYKRPSDSTNILS